MFNKKGFFMSFRDWLSFFVGLGIFLVGIVPLLGHFGVLPFGLPAALNTLLGSVAVWIIAIAGVYIIIDGIIEPDRNMLHMLLLGMGALFVIVGLIPILHMFGVIPFTIPFLDNLIVYNAILTVEGIMLMTAGFTMR